MDEIIEELRQRNEPVPTPLELPSDDDLVLVEEALLLPLPKDYRAFLLEVSDVVYGRIEPATAADPHSHTYLPEMAAIAWDQGLPRHLLPICERNQGYDCIDPDGAVSHWHQGTFGETTWETVWDWAHEVWLEQADD